MWRFFLCLHKNNLEYLDKISIANRKTFVLRWKKDRMRGKKCGICPFSDKKDVAPLCLTAGTGPAGPIKIRTLYIRTREANASLVRIYSCLWSYWWIRVSVLPAIPWRRCRHRAFASKSGAWIWNKDGNRLLSTHRTVGTGKLVNYWWMRVPVLPAIPWRQCRHRAFASKSGAWI